MLKNIPKILSPELLAALCEMGHSDRLVISDGNFPAHSMGKNAKVIRLDGHGVPEVLDAILKLFPLDTYTEKSVSLMEIEEIVAKYDERGAATIGFIERFKFYEEAKTSYLIIATSEKALYANIMLQKGVVTD